MLSLFTTQLDADQLKRLVSPVFFRLFPPRVVAKQVSGLATGGLSRARVERALVHLKPFVESRNRLLDDTQSPLNLSLEKRQKRGIGAGEELDRQAAERMGPLTLQLYFLQLMSGCTTFVDLSHAAFEWRPQGVVWSPKAVLVSWSEDFRLPLLDLYFGYYRADVARFERGLESLGLEQERKLLESHFGSAHAAVRFDGSHFRQTLGQIFDSCADRGATLHPDFIPLGVYLGTLYEHLERYPYEFDVARSFETAARAAAK